jgi:hypothetical protein
LDSVHLKLKSTITVKNTRTGSPSFIAGSYFQQQTASMAERSRAGIERRILVS